MIIGVEGQRIFRREKHGMDIVAVEYLRCLQSMDKENEYYVFVAPGPDRCLEETDNMHIVFIHCTFYPVWEQVLLPLCIRKYKLDFLHCTSNTAPVFCPVPVVLTLHDMIFCYPRPSSYISSGYQRLGRVYRRFIVPKVIKTCKMIITVSESEQRRMIQEQGVPATKLMYLYNGCSESFHQIDHVAEKLKPYFPETGYLFFLGNADPQKNMETTLLAYARYLKQSTKKRKLVIADMDRDKIDVLLKKNNIVDIEDHLCLVGYIPHARMPLFYNGAFAFLYTSIHESFGLPVLESMACGTPVIVGDIDALREVAGRNGLYTDPFSAESMAACIIRLESDALLYKEQQNYGLAQVEKYSWERSTNSLMSIYEQVGTNK